MFVITINTSCRGDSMLIKLRVFDAKLLVRSIEEQFLFHFNQSIDTIILKEVCDWYEEGGFFNKALST